MAYTEKVSISGTALSFLLYECFNSSYGQEGFLIGNITSEITNHISDSQSDSARLDTQVAIKTVLPLPSVSLFYQPTGRLREDVLRELLSSSASEVVGWYKYRSNSNLKPTFRDKLISKGLQKFFEKYHNRKTFVTCTLTNKSSVSGSTHTFTYRFGKINCFNMYEYVEDITANLGEKLTGYKKPQRNLIHGVFNKILEDSKVQSSNATDAILHIQEAVNKRLAEEAKITSKHECTIRDLEAEIIQMTEILGERQAEELHATYNRLSEEKLRNMEIEMSKECTGALQARTELNNIEITNFLTDSNQVSDTSEGGVQIVAVRPEERSPSPVLVPSKKPFNYAAALKSKHVDVASSSKTNNFGDDLISFDVEDNSPQKVVPVNNKVKCSRDSSPEY